MKAIIHVLIKSLVVPFYRNHAGLLFFVFFIMFGVVESTQIVLYHESLIYGMLSSKIFLLIVFIIWLLYQLKSLHFLIKTCDTDAYLFLHHISILNAWKSFGYFLVVSFLTFQPVFIYTLAIYVIGFKSKFYESLTLVFFFQLALWLMSAWVLNYSIRSRHIASWFMLPELALPLQQTKVGIYLGYLFKDEKTALLLSKLFSIFLIYFVKETLEPGDDFRIIGITWLFALLSHTYLINKLKVFEDHSMRWTKNLPISPTQTFATYFLLYVLLMIPELILLTGSIGKGLSFIHLLLLPFFSSAFLVAIHTYLFKPMRDPDKFTAFLFWLFIVCFFLILSSMIWITSVVLLMLSFITFKTWIYLYEPFEN